MTVRKPPQFPNKVVLMDVRLSHQRRNPGAFKRFGWAIVASSLLITSIAAVVHVRNPTDTLQPSVMSSAGMFDRSHYSRKGIHEGVQLLLESFVNALEHDDYARMHSVFPGMTPHDARVLRAVRKRLGESAHLTVGDVQLRRGSRLGAVDVDIDFWVLSSTAKDSGRLEMPFTAHVRNASGNWLIVELN